MLAVTRFPIDYVNKTVLLRFRGVESSFHLSHGLFSSFSIDAGTRLLLKSIAARVDLARIQTVLDEGCGVGVIGIAIARAAPQARVFLQDRDALAVAFARENCKVNGVENADLDCGLAFRGLSGRTFDLIASNLPAKAGKPVLESFFRAVPGLLSRTGTAAVVIVSPLADLAKDAILSSGCLLFHVERTSQHVVFHFQLPEGHESPVQLIEDLSPYLRTRQKFTAAGVEYELETAYNLADFDTAGYAVELAQDILAASKVRGRALYWNPGQGHLPVFAQKRAGATISGIALAGRDALELAITERNLESAGAGALETHLISDEAGLQEAVEPGSVDFFCALPHPVPKAPWHGDLVNSALRLLRPGGTFLTAAESTEVFRILSHCRRLTMVESRKRLGYRAVLLRVS